MGCSRALWRWTSYNVMLYEVITTLTQQLQELEANKSKSDFTPQSKWENIARKQATQAQLAIQKNQRLHEAVEEQLHLAQSLERIFAKKTKFTIESLCEDTYIPDALTLDPIARAARMNALLNQDYEKLESVFIQHGLMEFTEPIRRSDVEDDEKNNRIVLTFSQAQIAPMNTDIMLEGIWKFLRLEKPIITPNFSMRLIEIVDEDTVYFQFQGYGPGIPTLHTNFAVKRFREGDKATFVYRAIANG
ncbi:hypothetical protein THRCLA_10161, partial [Thraustotheca clavata]